MPASTAEKPYQSYHRVTQQKREKATAWGKRFSPRIRLGKGLALHHEWTKRTGFCALQQYLNFKEQRLTLFSTLKTLVVKHKHRFPLWRKFQIVKLQNNGVAGKCTLVTAKTGNKKLKCKRLLSKCMLHGWTLLQCKYEQPNAKNISQIKKHLSDKVCNTAKTPFHG